MPCNPLFLTRNEQVSGSSPLVGSYSLTSMQICCDVSLVRLATPTILRPGLDAAECHI